MKNTVAELAILFSMIIMLSASWKNGAISGKQPGKQSTTATPASPEYKTFTLKYYDRDSLDRIVPSTACPSCLSSINGSCSGLCRVMDLTVCDYIDAGDIWISKDTGYFYIIYKADGGWTIGEASIYIGSKEDIPLSISGIPVPSSFPVREEFSNSQARTVIFRIARDHSGAENPVILAHALVSRSGQSDETAWGHGNKTFREYFNIKRWGYLTDNL